MNDLLKMLENCSALFFVAWTVQNLEKITNFIDWATPKARIAVQFAAPLMQPKHSPGESRFTELITATIGFFVGVLVASFCTVLVTLATVLFAISALENGGELSAVQLVSVFA